MFQSATDFSIFIEKKAIDEGVSHMEALLEYCDSHQVEPAEIAHLVSESLKARLEMNFQDLNYLPRHARLDI